MSIDDPLSEEIIASCIEVHRHLGPGLLESAYEHCLCFELESRGLSHRRQVDLPILYKGVALDCGYRIDVIVEERMVVEVKAVEQLLPVHTAQTITYLKLSGCSVGLLVNFHTPRLKDGIRRLTLRTRFLPSSL